MCFSFYVCCTGERKCDWEFYLLFEGLDELLCEVDQKFC